MKIGIDIDNCIFNFDDTLLKEYLKHDKDLRNTGIINQNPKYLMKGMFDISYVVNGYNEKNDAVNEIIEIAYNNDKTYILAIGAITNVALAIKKDSKIVDKIEVVSAWRT